MKKIFGKELILDLSDCDPKIITQKKKILEYLEKICRLIKMKRYGKPVAKRFGFGRDFTAGFSFLQLIETSLISGHISELWRKVYINVFSCKDFDEEKAASFTQKFFKAKKIKKRVLIR
jgi:S-adenosylmethionine decarboxylase